MLGFSTAISGKPLSALNAYGTTPAAPRLVQSAKYQNASGSVPSSTGTVTLSAGPTVGNILIAAVSVWNSPGVVTPSGFAFLGKVEITDTELDLYYRIVESGDGTSYTITMNSSDYFSAVMMEISGAVLTGAQFNTGSASASTTMTTGSVTPSITGGLALAFRAQNTGVVANASYAPTTPTGYSLVQNAAASYNPLAVFSKDSISTTSSESVTLVTNTSGDPAGAILVLMPAAASTQTLTVSADGGVTTGWTAEGGDYTRVQSDDGDTTRLYTPNLSDIRTFAITDTSGLSGATINYVTIIARYKGIDPVPNTIQLGVRISSTNYWSGDLDGGGGQVYTFYAHTFYLDPSTSAAWTTTAIDAMEIGIQNTNATGKAVTYMKAIVGYTAGAGAITKTQGAIARIAKTLAKTQPSVARISATPTKTQPAIARVANSFMKTQTAVARVAKNLTKTQPALGRIATNRTVTQPAIARIATNLTKTQPATASITNGFTKTQAATARIAGGISKTQSATARVAANLSKTQPILARISVTRTITQPAIARVQKNLIKTQPALARLASGITKVQPATARINPTGVFTKTQPAIARIQRNLTATQSATAKIIQNSSYSLATGSFTGTGSAQSVSGLGFQPELVLIKNITAGGDTWFKTKDMPTGDWTLPIRSDAPHGTGYITSVDSGGFSVGTQTDVNGSGNTIEWVAVADGGAGVMATFTYTGNGTTQTISSLPFQPDYVNIKSDTGIVGAARFATATDTSMNYDGGGDRTNLITGFTATGFTLDSGLSGNLVNVSTSAHYGYAFKTTTGKVSQFSYTGDGVNPHAITTPGFSPAFLHIHATGGQNNVTKYSGETATQGQSWSSTVGTTSFVSLDATGFTVTADAAVNTTSTTYHALALTVSSGTASSTKTQGAVARIATAVTKTQPALARVAVNSTKTQPTIARIQKTVTKAQPAVARIIGGVTKTQPTIARVANSRTKTQGAIAHIVNNSTKTQPAIARIQKTVTKNQPTVARISVISTKSQPAIARIAIGGVVAKTQTATARIIVTTSRTLGQSASAFIYNPYLWATTTPSGTSFDNGTITGNGVGWSPAAGSGGAFDPGSIPPGGSGFTGITPPSQDYWQKRTL